MDRLILRSNIYQSETGRIGDKVRRYRARAVPG